MTVGSSSRRNTKPRGKVCAEADKAIGATPRTIPIFFKQADPSVVIAGLVPAIHVFFTVNPKKTWMSATSMGMTGKGQSGGKLASPLFALAPPCISAYSSRFNDPFIEIDLRPRSPAPAGYRGAFGRRYHRPARPLRGICRAQPPGRQEAHLLARPHPDQPVLRGFDPHPVLVRNRRKKARCRRHEHLGVLFLDAQGRNPDRYSGDPECATP